MASFVDLNSHRAVTKMNGKILCHVVVQQSIPEDCASKPGLGGMTCVRGSVTRQAGSTEYQLDMYHCSLVSDLESPLSNLQAVQKVVSIDKGVVQNNHIL